MPPCGHDERLDPDCPECDAWFRSEESYWRAYFGMSLETERRQREIELEDHGRVLTDAERMDEARRLK